MLLDVRPDHLESVRGILQRLVPDREVWAVGSRAKWTARDTSDLDLCIVGDTPLGFKRLGQLRDAFSESSLPYKVDVVDWATTSESFRKIIERDKVVVQSAARQPVEGEAGEWREVAIGELADIFDGPHATPPKTSNGPVFLGISNLAHGRLDLTNTEHLSEEAYRRWTRRVEPQAGDVVFSYETRLGEAALIPSGLRCCLGRRMGLLRARAGKVDSRFLLYAYLGPPFQETLRSRTIHGSTVNRIPLIDMPGFPIEVPEDIDEQRAIAHILGTLDDKIELNRRMNETLEAMARALFKSWFVDFEPVRAKAEGRDSGLPQPLADLLPASFEDSELGEIPKGWEVNSIGDLADVAGGTTPRTKEPAYWEGGTHHWATPKDLSGLSVPVLLDTERRITDAGLSQIGSGLLPKGTVLLSSRAPIGYLAVAEIPVAINQGFIAMIAKKWVSNLFLLLWASVAHEEIVSRANGSTFLEISKANFRPISVVAPSAVVMQAFDGHARPLYERIVECERESRTLAALRDTLLPKLISGEIRLKEAEKTVEAVMGAPR